MKRIESNLVGRKFRQFGAVKSFFHRMRFAVPAKRRRFNTMQVVDEGTTASFSTVLAFGVLDIFGPLLALSQDCLLFFVGLRALA
jgi:hypothetical protein